MRVQVRYFQSLQKLAGTAVEELTLPEGALLDDLVRLVIAAHPAFEPARPGLMLAVNEEHASGAQLLSPGDTIAIMPPFSGG